METLGDALAKRRSKVEVPQCCFEGYGLEQVGSKGSAPESCPRPVEESRTDAEGSKMNDEEEDEYSEYSDEDSSESSGEEHVDVPSTGTKKESDEFSDEPRTEALEGEESEEEYSDEYSEDEYSEISADEASGANKEAEKEESREGDSANPASPCDSNEEVDKDTGSAEKEERSAQGSGEERVDVSSTSAHKEALNEKDEYSYVSGSEALEGEESEDDEYSDEDECSSQHSVAEYNDVNAGGAEADEASGANEEAEKEEPVEIMLSVPEGGDFMCPAPPRDLQEEADKDSGSAEKHERPLQSSGEELASSTGAHQEALNEKDEYSDGSGSEGLEGEEGEEDEYSDEDECSSQHSVAEYNDVNAGGAEADEASSANEEAEKEEPVEIMVSVPEGGDFMCPAPPFPPTLLTSGFKASGQDATEEAEKKQPPEIGSKVDGEDYGSPDPTTPDPVCGSQDEVGDAQVDEQLSQQDSELITGGIDPANPVSDAQEEVRDAEVDEHSSPHSTAEYHDVMGSEAAADANEEAEKNESLEIVSKVDGEDHAENPDPVSDLQEEVRDAEVDEHSSHHSTAEYHDVMGSEAEADDASGPEEGVEKEEPADIALNVEHDAEATSGTSHSAQSHLPQVFDIGSPKADEPGAEEATDEAAAAAEDDDFAAPHPDEEHLDVPSTGATKLHQECEDPDESGSECSDDEDSEASAYEVGGSDEEADNEPDCDGGPDPANLEPPATAQQSASLPEFFDIGSMDDSAPEADEPSEPKAEAAESAEAAAVEAKTEAAAAQAAAELEEAAAAEDSPKQNPDVRVMSQTDPQVNSSDKKMSMRIERTSADSQLVNPSAGLAKPSHAAGIGGSRALMGTGSTATDVLQRRGSMSLLEDPLGHTAQTVPQAQASGAMASGTQTGIDSVPGPVMKREVALCGRTVLEDGPWLPLRFQAATEVPVSVKPDASGRTHTLPSSLLTRDPTKPRPKKTLRFSEHVDHRSISPRPRSATAPEASGMEDKKRTAQSGPSTATKPVPVQSSSFSEFLFLPPVPENKTEPPPQSLSNFLFAPNGSTAQHAVPAVEMETSRRSGEEHHASSAHHHSSDAHDSSPCQVDQMALEAHERDLACSLERRVLERAYFLHQNGHSDDPLHNYYTALRIEMSLSA